VYSVGLAYLLWVIGGFGALGLHRFYLGKFGTGILYFFTGGLGMIGSFYDLVTLPAQVNEANRKLRYLRGDEYYDGVEDARYAQVPAEPVESVERIILKSAKANRGVVTPSQLALEGNMPMEEAKEYLEDFVRKGFSEIRVRRNGSIAYVFPEFLDTDAESQFEDF
jgi:hypothetical protein